MKKTQYIFQVQSVKELEHPITVNVGNSEVVLRSESKDRPVAALGDVTIEGEPTYELQIEARKALAKVILTNLGCRARMMQYPTGCSTTEIDGNNKKITIVQSLKIAYNINEVYDKNASDVLKVRLDGDEIPILQFYEALTREHPLDKYRELFKVIEYFCDQGTAKVRMKNRLRRGLKNKHWFLPPSTFQDLSKISQLSRISKPRSLISHLVKTRDKCSHLKSRFGIAPYDDAELDEVKATLPVIEGIVKYTLEVNPLTKV